MAKRKIAKQDFSGWTFQPLDDSGKPVVSQNQTQITASPSSPSLGQQVVQASVPAGVQVPAAQPQAPPPPPEPDMTTQDAHTFATLSANKAIENMRQQGAQPLVEDFKKVYEDAYSKATDLQKTLTTQKAQQQMELIKQTALQQSAAQIDVKKAADIATGAIPIEVAKTQQVEQARSTIEAATKLQEAQAAEGLTPAQALAQYKLANPDYTGTTAPGLIKALPTTESDKAENIINAYKSLSDLHAAYTQQHANAGAAQGLIGGSILGPIAAVSSPSTIAYNSLIDDTSTSIARGMGDTSGGATKSQIQEQIKSSLPMIQDSDDVAGQKIFLRKKLFLNNLQTQRDMLVGHYDVSRLDGQIATINSELGDGGTLSKYNPLKAPSVVAQNGLSPTANANFNAKIAPTPAPQNQQVQQPTMPDTSDQDIVWPDQGTPAGHINLGPPRNQPVIQQPQTVQTPQPYQVLPGSD